MEFLLVAAVLGIIPGLIASTKGRSFGAWWLYGFLVFIIALPHALLIDSDSKFKEARELALGAKKCPYCAELIKAEARVCRYCRRELPTTPESQALPVGQMSGQPGSVAWSESKLRLEPQATGHIITRLRRDTAVVVLETRGEWSRAFVPSINLEGWLLSDSLQLIAQPNEPAVAEHV